MWVRGSMLTNAFRLAALLNGYLVTAGPPKAITIPKASELAKIQEITVRGILLRSQLMMWNARIMKRQLSIGKHGGRYKLEDDSSLEFCLGVKSLQPHVVCRLPDATAYLPALQSGNRAENCGHRFLRCSFSKSGFVPQDNAHIFEIRPVRTVEIDGELHSFELDVVLLWFRTGVRN